MVLAWQPIGAVKRIPVYFVNSTKQSTSTRRRKKKQKLTKNTIAYKSHIAFDRTEPACLFQDRQPRTVKCVMCYVIAQNIKQTKIRNIHSRKLERKSVGTGKYMCVCVLLAGVAVAVASAAAAVAYMRNSCCPFIAIRT